MKVPNVRFNLKFYDEKGNEQIVRTLDELKVKYNLSDLYDYYKEGTLSRWLLSIGEGATAVAVDKLELSDPDADGVNQLTSTLGIELPESDLTEFAKVLQLQARLQKKQREQPDAARECQPVESYLNLLQQLIDNPDDFIVVRGIVEKIMEKYPDKFRQDWMRSDWRIVEWVPVLPSVVMSRPIWCIWLACSVQLEKRVALEVRVGTHVYSVELDPYFTKVRAKPSTKDLIAVLPCSGYLVLKPEWKI